MGGAAHERENNKDAERDHFLDSQDNKFPTLIIGLQKGPYCTTTRPAARSYSEQAQLLEQQSNSTHEKNTCYPKYKVRVVPLEFRDDFKIHPGTRPQSDLAGTRDRSCTRTHRAP